MNEAIKPGEVFYLAELVPYQAGKATSMTVVSNEKMRLVVKAFDGTACLPEHPAPGAVIVFALDGHGIISYEGEEHAIAAGEQMHFAKGGMHTVRTEGRLKIAVLAILE